MRDWLSEDDTPSLGEALVEAAEVAWHEPPSAIPRPELNIVYQHYEKPIELSGKFQRKRGDLCRSLDDPTAWDFIKEELVLYPTMQADGKRPVISLTTRQIVMTRVEKEIKPYFQKENYFIEIAGKILKKCSVWTFHEGTIQTLECEYDNNGKPIKYTEKINGEIVRIDTLVYREDQLIKRESDLIKPLKLRTIIGDIVPWTQEKVLNLKGNNGYLDQYAVPDPRGAGEDIARLIPFNEPY